MQTVLFSTSNHIASTFELLLVFPLIELFMFTNKKKGIYRNMCEDQRHKNMINNSSESEV